MLQGITENREIWAILEYSRLSYRVSAISKPTCVLLYIVDVLKTGVDHSDVIQLNYVWLVDNLDVKHSRLLHELLQSGVLNTEEVESINCQVTSLSQTTKLLAALGRKSKDQFDRFLEALDNTRQQYIRDHITGRQGQAGPELTILSPV